MTNNICEEDIPVNSRPNSCDSCGRIPSFVQDKNGHYVACMCGERSQHMKTRPESVQMWNHDHKGVKKPNWARKDF